ncbi:MAG: DUF2207 domain-containing protein, partial [Dehalococcoidia bacterium]
MVHLRWRDAVRGAAGLIVLGGLLAAGLLVASTAGAQAQAGERIHRYGVAINIARDGAIEVLETIEYDFGADEAHEVVRDIRTRAHYDDTHDRVYRLSVLQVTAGSGASAAFEVERPGGGVTRIRIAPDGDGAGDPGGGRHRYTILYRVHGAMTDFATHDELAWTVVAPQWDVPIEVATVQVNAPAEVQRARCFAGPAGSALGCEQAAASASTAMFTDSGLDPLDAVTVVVALPPGTVTDAAPLLIERWALSRAFTTDRVTLAATGLVAAAVVAVLGRLAWLIAQARGPRRSRLEGGAVEYAPPAGMRAGEAGTLREGIAHPRDVAAMIVDLAIRGALGIEEVDESGLFRSRHGWRLVRLPTDAPLDKFERLLLDAVFEHDDEVLLTDLGGTFTARLPRVQAALDEAAVARGWRRRNIEGARTRWLAAGIAMAAGGLALTALAAAFTAWGIVPAPLVVGGVVLIGAHHALPALTPRGAAALRHLRGFERYLGSAEVYRSGLAERSHLFFDYLPYALAHGLAGPWARAFEGLDDLVAPGWYSGGEPFSPGGL